LFGGVDNILLNITRQLAEIPPEIELSAWVPHIKVGLSFNEKHFHDVKVFSAR